MDTEASIAEPKRAPKGVALALMASLLVPAAAACADNTVEPPLTTPPSITVTTENSTGEWDVQGPRIDLPRSIPEGTSHDLKPKDIPQITEDFEKQMLDIYTGGDRLTGQKIETGFLKLKEYPNYKVAQISGYLVGYHEVRINNFFGFSNNPPLMSYIILAGRNSDGSTWTKAFILGRPDTDRLAVWNHYKTEELIENPVRLENEAYSRTDVPISEISSILEDKSYWLTPQVVIDIPISVQAGALNSELFDAGAINEMGANNQIVDDLQNHGGQDSNLAGWATGIYTFP